MTKRRASMPFAARAQLVVVLLLLACFFLVGQRFSFELYSYGLITLMILTIVQIALGNTDPKSGVWRTVRNLGITILIVGIVVGGSVLLAPTLVGFGR